MRKLAVAVVLAVAGLAVAVALTSRSRMAQAENDARIVTDTHELLEQQLASLEADDPIIRRYGAFQRWDRGDWSRPRYAFMLVSRLGTRGIACFERANADVAITITGGPQHVTVTMTPSDEWVLEQPNRQLKAVGREMLAIGPDSQSCCSLQAVATHPDFVAE